MEVGVNAILGIDVGKSDFHCALLEEDQLRSNSFPNTPAGFKKFASWLRNRKVARVRACLESTGGWSEDLGEFLHEAGHVVSIANAAAIKAFGQSELSRTKTDKADAALIARYCRAMNPRVWSPPSPSERRLQHLERRRVALVEMRAQEINRLKSPGIDDVRSSLEATIAFLKKQIEAIESEINHTIDQDPTLREKRKLLESIPGIGETASMTLLGELPNILDFRSAKAVAAYVGLCPREFRSGTSVSKSWVSKAGNKHVRRMLYLPAVTAIRFNPAMTAFAERLRVRGKREKQIIVAVMRKLVVIAYTILKSAKPYQAALAP